MQDKGIFDIQQGQKKGHGDSGTFMTLGRGLKSHRTGDVEWGLRGT